MYEVTAYCRAHLYICVVTTQPDNQPTLANDAHEGHTLSLRINFGRASFKANGDAAAVLGAFDAFQAFHAAQPPSADESQPDKTNHEPPSSSSPEQAQPEPTSSASGLVPLSVFLSQKQLPRGNAIIALGIAVWAKRYKGEDVFTADTMKAFWRDSKKKVPANIARDLGTAASEGWLERLTTGAGNYGLTSYGESHFDGLPEVGA